MWGRSLGVVVAMAMVLGGGVKADAEIYLWTDEQGVVHMTDQWSNVPESARVRVVVRDTTPPLNDGTPAMELVARPLEPVPVRPSPMLLPRTRSYVHQPTKVSPPFPYNVQLDPVDPNFVWVGRNRVPKDTLTYPRVSLDAQAQFRNRIRSLEQRRSIPPPTFRTPATRP